MKRAQILLLALALLLVTKQVVHAETSAAEMQVMTANVHAAVANPDKVSETIFASLVDEPVKVIRHNLKVYSDFATALSNTARSNLSAEAKQQHVGVLLQGVQKAYSGQDGLASYVLWPVITPALYLGNSANEKKDFDSVAKYANTGKEVINGISARLPAPARKGVK